MADNDLVVLDSWPVMEWLKGRQPASQAFEALLFQAQRREVQLCMSRINLGEVSYSVVKEFGEQAGAALLAQFMFCPVEIVSVTDADVDAAARLKARYRIAYADAFAAVLAITRGAPLVTGDPEFRRIASAGRLRLHWVGK